MNPTSSAAQSADLEQFVAACAAYSARNGRDALFPYIGPGGRHLVRRADDVSVTLVALHTHQETELPRDRFRAEFRPYFIDEVDLFFGSEQTRNALQAELDAQLAASRYCIDQELAGASPAATS